MINTNYKSIVARLIGCRNKVAGRLAFEGSIDILAFGAVIVFAFWAVTGIFWPAPTARVIAIALATSALGFLIGLLIFKPLVRKNPLTAIALRLEKHYGKLQSRLIGSLQLYDKLRANKENYSIELIEKTIEDAGSEIRELDFDVVVEKNRRPYYRLAFGLLLIVFAIVASSPTFSQAMLLFTNPLADIHRPTKLMLAISPVSSQALKNEDVTVHIFASGEKIRQVGLNFRFNDGDWVKVPAVNMSGTETASDSVFSYTFRKVKRDIEYFADARNIKSATGNITIIDPPRLLDVSITLDFPQYTGMGKQTLPNNDGSVTAIKGTIVNFKGRLNKPAAAAAFEFKNGQVKKSEINGDEISGRFTLAESGSYHIAVIDSGGLANPNPIEYDLVCLEDYPPQIQITFPAVDIDLDERMVIPIEASVLDDFGFSKLELVYWTYSEGHESDPKREVIKSDFGKETETVIAHDWLVEDLHMMPGDLVYYYMEIFDNDAISGAKSTVSKTYSARLPSLDEIMADITGSQDETLQDVEETVKSQKELSDRLENLSREMMQNADVDWEKKQQIQETLDRQKEIADKIQDIAERMDEAIDKFERNQMATEEMMQKMQELRDLFEEVATPELKEAMQKLQDALQNMDPDMLKKAMENFQLSAEQVNENLDRMMALLKKYQLEQKLDTMAKMAEKLAEQQQDINDKLGQCNSKSDFGDLEQPQKKQDQGLESLKQQLKDAQNMNNELNMVPQDQMQQADQKLNSEQLKQMMSQMNQSLGMCNKSQCSKSGQQIQREFQDMASLFQQMLQQMQSQQQEMITGLIKKAINDVLYLSHQQEDLIDSTKTALKSMDDAREMARDQNDLQSACDRVSASIADITKETLFVNSAILERLGNALANMRQAIERLNGRFPDQSSSDQVDAMTSLNQAAAMLMNSLNQASQCNSSGTGMQSLMEKLGQMAQQQQQLNQGSQSILPLPMPGQMMSMAQQQALQRLAAQQEQLRKSLKQLMDEAGNSSENTLGRLDQIEQDMKKIVEDMQKNQFNQQSIQRQERILSRLLDAQRSVNRRDYSQRRQARSAEDIIRRGPSGLDFGDNQNERLSEDIKKALSEKYPRRYEGQIKEYFKAITEDQSGE